MKVTRKQTSGAEMNESETRTLSADEPGPVLAEVDDSSERFKPSGAEVWWAPGLIEVEFTHPMHSGVQTDLFDPGERIEFSEAWSTELRSILESNGLVTWKPSFPLMYPWSPDDSEGEAIKYYRETGRARFVTLNFPLEADLTRIADKLRKLPEIVQAVPVPQIAPPVEPLLGTSDQVMNMICRPNGCLQNQWYIFRCCVNQAWSVATGKGVNIADIDWGFNPDHEDLQSNIKVRHSMLPLSHSADVASGLKCDHGTSALGLAGAQVNNLGMAGVAFEANLWAIQAGSDTVINHDHWATAIQFVLDRPSEGRKVIILEIQTGKLGNIEMSPVINKAIIDAIDKKIVVCVPAGNGNDTKDAAMGDDGKLIPETGSILVGATRYDPVLNIMANSNGGSRVVVYAPGDPLRDVTCSVNGYRNRFGGTSGAVAKVAGAVALMLEVNPTLSPAAVREILQQSPTHVVDNSGQQVGVLLNAEQAVCEALRRAGGQCSALGDP